jgi:transposase InsO family protein
MGSVGSCFDNAMMESFWSRMQVELLDRQTSDPRRLVWHILLTVVVIVAIL